MATHQVKLSPQAFQLVMTGRRRALYLPTDKVCVTGDVLEMRLELGPDSPGNPMLAVRITDVASADERHCIASLSRDLGFD